MLNWRSCAERGLRGGTRYLVALSTLLVSLALPKSAWAIPAFARAYEVPCSTCHITITRRGEFGDAFRRGGYHWPGDPSADSEVRKEKPIAMQGVAPLTTQLPARVPISLAARIAGTYSTDPSLPDELNLGSPSFNFLFGGALGENASFFGTWAGSGAPNELYLHFARLAGGPELNLRIGKFEQWSTMFKNNEALINTFQLTTSAINGYSVGVGRTGGELNGIVAKRGFWAAGIVQNDAVPGAHFDAYYHLGLKIGGMDFLGNEPDIDFDAEPSALDDFSATLATWGYWGEVRDADATPTQEIRRLGLEAKIYFKLISLWTGWMAGFDNDLTLVGDSRSESSTVFGELSYPVTSWFLPIYLYQYQDASSFNKATQQHDIGALFLPYENIRVRAKFTAKDNDMKDEVAELQILFGL